MPTLELFTIPSDPNACHNVIAPGGYEYWSFDVESGGRTMTIAFWIGCQKLQAYLDHYRAFRARPTKVAPPLPRDYSAVTVYVDGRLTVNRIDAKDVVASSEKLELRMGENRCFTNASAEIEIILQGGAHFFAPKHWQHAFSETPVSTRT